MSPNLTPQLCLVIGDPVAHSLSPVMHTAGYTALGIADEFTYQAQLVKIEELENFVRAVREKNIRGVSCKAPHKTALMQYLDVIDPIAQRIGAVNAIVNDDGRLTGYNTDWMGVVIPLERLGGLAGKKVALIGAGGAARAAAYGLTEHGAEVTIYNRTLPKAQALAAEFGGQGTPLEKLSTIEGMDIVINATSHEQTVHEPQLSALPEYMRPEQILFDMNYGPATDILLGKAKQQGARTIDGLEMLLQQGLPQFKLFTGRDAPEAVMRAAVKSAVRSLGDK